MALIYRSSVKMYEYIFDASFVRVDQRDKMLRDSAVKIINNELILDN